jgi:hypothetical protein
LARGQEPERVDIAVRIRRHADAEVDVRLGVLRLAGPTGRADAPALGDLVAARDGDGAEVDERDRVAVGRLDRHRAASAGHGAGERDRAGRRRLDERACRRGDVDAAMLLGRIGIVPEDEGS